jgi:hypothetical protein
MNYKKKPLTKAEKKELKISDNQLSNLIMFC